MMKALTEYFRGVKIVSTYGCFAPALWNGGRAIAGHTPKEEVKWTIEEFNKRGVPIRYTFTNPSLTEADLRDPFCNRICRLAENGFNEIIINAPFLEKYIREKYPKFPLTSSTVKQIEDYDELMREFEKDYKLVVLDYNWNNDFEKLDRIPKELRKRCASDMDEQIMINPLRTRANSQDPLKEATEFGCKNTLMNFYQVMNYKTFITRELLDKYLEMGFDNFKIEGRVLSSPNVVESYVYYLVKPEYRDLVRLELLTAPKIKRPDSSKPKSFFIDYDGKEIPQKDE